MDPWLAMAIVIGSLGALVFTLRLVQRLTSPHPELVRKMLHVGMGLLTLTFPLLFDRVWPILVLAAFSVGAMLSMRLVRGLKSSIGCVVGSVSRSSLGEVYFPIAVAILFLLYLLVPEEDDTQRLMLYCIPLLLLTLADALAALIGVRYGQRHYATSDGRKSIEGSLAFFLVGFFCAHVPLLLCTEIDRTKTLLISLLLAWLAMMFEAIAWGGLDNLALPLVSYLLLRAYFRLTTEDLLLRIGITAALMILAGTYSRRSTLVGSAVFGVVLMGYVSWALGGWEWFVPPATLFLSYTLLSPRNEINSRRIHNIHAVVCVSSAGLLWLFLFSIMDRPEYLYLFTLSFAAHLAIIGVARLGSDYPTMRPLPLIALCAVQGWLLLFVPWLLLHEPTPTSVVRTLLALPAVMVAAFGFYVSQPDVRNCPIDTPRWLRQAVHAALASVLGMAPLYLI